MKHILILLLVLAGLSSPLCGEDVMSNNEDWHKSLLRLSAYWSKQGCDDLAEEYAGIVAKTDAPKVREEKANALSGLDRAIYCMEQFILGPCRSRVMCKYWLRLAEKQGRQGDADKLRTSLQKCDDFIAKQEAILATVRKKEEASLTLSK